MAVVEVFDCHHSQRLPNSWDIGFPRTIFELASALVDKEAEKRPGPATVIEILEKDDKPISPDFAVDGPENDPVYQSYVEEISKYILAIARLQGSQPGFLAEEMFAKVIYGSHPAGRISLTPEELQNLTPEVLARFHAAHYNPNNAIFAIVGDVKPAEIVGKLERAFRSWQRREAPDARDQAHPRREGSSGRV